MSLRDAPVLYLFLETSALPRQRALLEELFELPVLEIEPHLPHHRHGVVKYDGGDLILSLNLTGPSRFEPTHSDAVTTVLVEPSARRVVDRVRSATNVVVARDEPGASTAFTDKNGHHFRFLATPLPRDGHRQFPVVTRLHLVVTDLANSIAFYVERLGLPLLVQDTHHAVVATGSVDIELEQRPTAIDGRKPRTSTSLIVFHTTDIGATTRALAARGVEFRAQRAGFSEIGGTIRFDDPSGHRLCLYEPSEESLAWGSGSKVLEIAGRTSAR